MTREPPSPNRLRALLALLQITERQAARELGVSAETMAAWCSDLRLPTRVTRARLDRFLQRHGWSAAQALDGTALPADLPDAVRDALLPPPPPKTPKRRRTMELSFADDLTPEDLKHFGLQADPFEEPTDRAEIWLPAPLVHIENKLLEGIRRRQIVALVGECGSGKTTLLRRLRVRALRESRIRLIEPADLDRSKITHTSLMVACVRALTGENLSGRSATMIADRLRAVLIDHDNSGLYPALIVDEAHRLDPGALIAIKELWDSGQLFQPLAVLLFGQPTLADTLKRNPAVRELTLRTRLHQMAKLSPEGVQGYLDWRMQRGGRKVEDLFEPSAFKALAARAEHPKWLNNLVVAALKYTRGVGDVRVSAQHIGRAA